MPEAPALPEGRSPTERPALDVLAETQPLAVDNRRRMTQDDIDQGRLIVLVGVAPVKPAEFVIIRIFQYTAEAQS